MFQIRCPAGERDWQQYYDLRYQVLFQPYGCDYNEKWLKQADRWDTVHLGLFDDNNQLIGVGMLNPEKLVARVRFVGIQADYQRQGFGKVLMEQLEKEAIKRHFDKVVLDAKEDAVDFYRKIGYRVIGPSSSLNGLKRWLMEKCV
ncbi:putative acetyltransferase [Halotydeus destructor]|nr:putative acetyltransferase [Halotydeus destructor]